MTDISHAWQFKYHLMSSGCTVIISKLIYLNSRLAAPLLEIDAIYNGPDKLSEPF